MNKFDDDQYKNKYSEQKFWLKLKTSAQKAGVKVIYAGLLLYYALKSPQVPTKVKGVILGALGYFILPIDIIPDIVPFAGFTDDLGVLLAALSYLAVYIYRDTSIQMRAKAKLAELFGDINDSELLIIDKKIAGKDN
ncbi:MAG: DUF1232 domain-containing protein [Desulfotomaculum sp.]|nr:DUF1232 domain-containing protein [Desulfotomaculum sp.]